MTSISEISKSLLDEGVVVMRTDTIYGVIARADSQKAVEKVYTVKQRAVDKPSIVLIADPNSVPAHNELIEFYSDAKKNPTSIVVPASDEPSWITRGGDSVAYRLVQDETLKAIINQVGPLVAPSANPEGKPPAKNIAEAKAYFGKQVNLYVDGGEVPDTVHASRIILVNPDGSVDYLR